MKRTRTIKITGREGGGAVINAEKSAKVGDILTAPGDLTLEEAALLVGNGRAVDSEPAKKAPAKAK